MAGVTLPHVASGKVRDIYELDDKHLLFVTSDRMSAFDVVMAEPIPDKGRVLTAITAFWVDQLAAVAPNHLVSLDVPPGAAAGGDDAADLEGRVMVVRRAEMLPIECIVRGYLSGSAWAEYRRTQTMHGQTLPAGLRQSERLPEPVFTPVDQGHLGPRREHLLRGGRRSGRRRAGRGGPPHQPGGLPAGRGAGRRAGDHHRRHQVRARHHRRPAGHLRRGADPGLVPLLAGRPVGAGRRRRRRSTSSRCGTGWRRRGGTRRRRRRPCPPRSCRPPGTATSTPTSG